MTELWRELLIGFTAAGPAWNRTPPGGEQGECLGIDGVTLTDCRISLMGDV